jgi:hypothetical protein
MVCSPCWEPRHPQDFIRPIKERNSVPWTRPRPLDVFIETCDIYGVNGIAGIAVAGCAINGYDNGQRELLYPSTFNPNTL